MDGFERSRVGIRDYHVHRLNDASFLTEQLAIFTSHLLYSLDPHSHCIAVCIQLLVDCVFVNIEVNTLRPLVLVDHVGEVVIGAHFSIIKDADAEDILCHFAVQVY